MSPFLAQVQVINVAGSPAESAKTDSSTPSEESIRALAMQVKASALAKAQKNLEQAKADLDADTSDITAHTEARHHEKSSKSDDTVFAAIPIVAIVFTFLYLIVRALMAPFSNRRNRGTPPSAGGFSDEEIAIVDKLQRTLAQMENRVESLETILIDQTRNKEKYGTKL